MLQDRRRTASLPCWPIPEQSRAPYVNRARSPATTTRSATAGSVRVDSCSRAVVMGSSIRCTRARSPPHLPLQANRSDVRRGRSSCCGRSELVESATPGSISTERCCTANGIDHLLIRCISNVLALLCRCGSPQRRPGRRCARSLPCADRPTHRRGRTGRRTVRAKLGDRPRLTPPIPAPAAPAWSPPLRTCLMAARARRRTASEHR